MRPGTRLPPAAHPKSLFVTVIGILHCLSPRAWAGDGHRGLLCNLSLSFSLSNTHTRQFSLSPRSLAELSDETNGKTHYRSSWPMMERCRAGGEEEGEERGTEGGG